MPQNILISNIFKESFQSLNMIKTHKNHQKPQRITKTQAFTHTQGFPAQLIYYCEPINFALYLGEDFSSKIISAW